MKRRNTIITVLCTWLLWGSILANAHASSSTESEIIRQTSQLRVNYNDVVLSGTNTYRFGKQDGFIVFNMPPAVNIENKGFWFKFSMTENAHDSPANNSQADRVTTRDSKIDKSVEIFWAIRQQQFSVKNKITFKLKSQASSQQFFVPFGLFEDRISAIRIDMDYCDCEVTIAEPRIDTFRPELRASIPESTELDLRLRSKIGQQIDIGYWSNRDLVNSAKGQYKFAGYDPRIINSRPLGLSAGEAAGVYFEFIYDHPHRHQMFEVFWGFNNERWSALRSTHFVLPKQIQSGDLRKVYLSFDELHTSKVLDHIRFDFTACETCVFTLKQSKIVGHDEVQNYQMYQPERAYYVNTESPPKRSVLKAFVKKLTSDFAFIISYILLLLLVALCFFVVRLRR